MAFTNSPKESTYRTVDMDFTAVANYRDGNVIVNQRDVQITNMYYDRVSKENQERWWALKKRQGISSTALSLQKVASTDVINGYFYDADSNHIYWAIKGKVYNMNLATNVITLIQTMTNTASLYVGFCAFLKATTGARYVIFTDGLECYYSVAGSGTATEITDPELPIPHQPFPIYLDDYLFLIKSSTGDIYNSDFDDPTSWTAGNYVTTEISPDTAIRLEKVKNYLVCFGKDDIEFFFNAANESGSPLGRNESYTQKIGYLGSCARHGHRLVFVGRAAGDRARVYMLDGEACKPISNTTVERNLQDTNLVPTEFNQQYNTGHIFAVDGHVFYMLITSNTIWICDLDEGFWYQWKDTATTKNNVTFEAVWSTQDNGTYVASYNRNILGLFTSSTYQDYGSNFPCIYVTEDYDGGTMNWKTCSRLTVRADMPSTAASNLAISWSDNDWNTSTTPRNINVNSLNPYITQLGRFRNRSYKLEYSDNYPIRMHGITMDLNVGNH